MNARLFLLAFLVLLAGCIKPFTKSDVSTTKERVDTLRTPVVVNIPKSDVHVDFNIDSLLSAAKGKNQILYLKGESGRSSFGLSVSPTGKATVDCHCADSTLKVMQILVTKLIEKDRTIVQEEQPTVFGKLVEDTKNGLFWVLLAAAIVGVLIWRK